MKRAPAVARNQRRKVTSAWYTIRLHVAAGGPRDVLAPGRDGPAPGDVGDVGDLGQVSDVGQVGDVDNVQLLPRRGLDRGSDFESGLLPSQTWCAFCSYSQP